MADNVLPDSRLRDPKATVMVDWPVRDQDGSMRTIRLELEPIYCINCGKPNGYVPRDVVSFVSWMCMGCAEEHAEYAANWQHSDQSFWDDVAAEMIARFGHVLTQKELDYMADQGKLGAALELLERESPYK